MESGGKSVTKRHRKKWVDALSLVLPVLLFFAVLNCFTTYLYYQDYQCKMDILTEVAAGAETTGMDVAAGWLKGNDHQANEQGKQLLEQYGYCENKGTSFYVRFRQNIMITGCTSAVLCLSLLTFLFYRKKAEAKESRKRLEQLEQILIAFRENHFEAVPDTEDHVGQERLKFQLEAIGHHIQLLQEEARAEKESTKEMNILSVRRQLFDLRMEHKKEVALNRRTLELAYENMINSLKMWEARYLIKSSSNGTVILGKSWGISNVINEGDTVCSVVSEQKGQPTGRVKLSQEEVAEIRTGDKVNIALKKYPVHTYGYLTGEVASIAYVPYSKNYAVEINFPYGLNTTTKDEIEYEIGLSGKAEIITSDRSILSRIFTPLYQLTSK